MPLRFNLGPGEKLYIGKTVVINSQQRCQFVVEGDGPILRERDVMTERQNSSPIELVYCCLQRFYLTVEAEGSLATYAKVLSAALARGEINNADASALNQPVNATQIYQALKMLKKLLPKTVVVAA